MRASLSISPCGSSARVEPGLGRAGAIELQPLESSVLQAAGYDGAQRVLRIRFLTGRIYDYLDVPSQSWAALQAAGSKGRYFNFYIRGRYRYRRLS
jgi:hypothetical protein